MNFIMQLDPQTGMELIDKARESKAEERTWSLWVSIFPNMDEEHFINYEDFKAEVGDGRLEKRSDEDIITQAERTKAADQRKEQRR